METIDGRTAAAHEGTSRLTSAAAGTTMRRAPGRISPRVDDGTEAVAGDGCAHLHWMRDVAPRSIAGCEECIASSGHWVELRVCLTCGHVGCCDSSPGRHADEHFTRTGHPIIRPVTTGDSWYWCYIDRRIVATGTSPRRPDPVRRGSPGAAPMSSAGVLSRLIGAPHRHDYVIGVIDDPLAARRGAHALKIYGFPARDVVLQTGEALARRTDREEIAAMLRQLTPPEGAMCRTYTGMAPQSTIVSVHTPTAANLRRACRILTAYGAHSMLHFGERDVPEAVPDGLHRA